jgi:hypothetical protein
MPWNPFSQAIEILGADHNYGSERYVQYSDKTDQFELVSNAMPGIDSWAHGYDHVAVNPFNGDVYMRFYSGFTGTITVGKRPLGASSFVQIPKLTGETEQVAIGATWWSGSFAGGGAQGSFVLFNSGNAVGTASDGHIAAYDPIANTWFLSKTGMAPFYGATSGYTYSSVIEYSPQKNVAVYGGGNAAPDKLWRLDADASFTPMPDAPAGKEIGIQRGLLVNEPITGNFLLLSAGELWELDPTGSGTWTKQSGSRVPPAGVGIPGPTTIDGMIVSSIPEYGVVVYVKQTSPSGGTVFVYRHA